MPTASDAIAQGLLPPLAAGVLDALPVATVVADPGGRVVFANQAFEHLTDLPLAQVLGHDWDQRVLAACRARRAIAWTEAPLRDARGVVVGRVVTARDAAPTGPPELVLRANEERLRILIESTPAGVAMLDRELRYIACSRRWVSDYRLEGQPLIGRCHYDVFPEIPARWREIHRLALSGAPQRCDEDRFERADGSVQWLRWAIEPWRDADGAIGGVIFFTEDITPRKQLEAQRERLEDELRQAQKLDSLGKLAGGIAHDFNNLIGVIVGNVELARQLDPAPALCACLDDIAAAGARAGELVRQILTFSRRHPARRVVTVPGPVVAEVARLLRATVPAGVRLQVEVADDVPPVRIAPNQIHQVLMNLAANAWQAMPGGSGNVGLRVTGVTVPVGTTHPVGLAPGRHALLQVSDDGTGMTPDVQARMFEPFFTTKSVGAGTGLGLPVVHGIVAGHGGVIHVDSAPGRGTTVSIWLPEATPEAAPEPAPTASLPRGAGHLLVLDDEELLVRVEARLLEQLGFTVDQFVRPADAIAAVRAHPGRFDAVLTDQNMPGLGGLEVARAIAAIRPDLPIVLLSGDRIYSDEQLAAANVRACLDKPYSADALGEVVARVLRR